MSAAEMSVFQTVAPLQTFSVPRIYARPIAQLQKFSVPRSYSGLTTLSSSLLRPKLPGFSCKPFGDTLKHHRYSTVCVFGGKNSSDGGNEASPWKALENAMGNLKKEQSIEDVLRQQMQKQEYLDDGGSGSSPPGGSSGGGGGGDTDEPDSTSMLEELMHVVLATVGFIFLYIYIIEGEEINRFALDILKFVFGRGMSIRLRRAIDDWKSFFQSLGEEEEEDPYWLEREIVSTNTWWDGPSKYKYLLRRSQSASRYY